MHHASSGCVLLLYSTGSCCVGGRCWPGAMPTLPFLTAAHYITYAFPQTHVSMYPACYSTLAETVQHNLDRDATMRTRFPVVKVQAMLNRKIQNSGI